MIQTTWVTINNLALISEFFIPLVLLITMRVDHKFSFITTQAHFSREGVKDVKYKWMLRLTVNGFSTQGVYDVPCKQTLTLTLTVFLRQEVKGMQYKWILILTMPHWPSHFKKKRKKETVKLTSTGAWGVWTLLGRCQGLADAGYCCPLPRWWPRNPHPCTGSPWWWFPTTPRQTTCRSDSFLSHILRQILNERTYM